MLRFILASVVLASLTLATYGMVDPKQSVPSLIKTLGEVNKEAQELEDYQSRLFLKIGAVDFFASELAEERMSLEEAVSRTLQVHQDDPKWLENCRVYYPTTLSNEELTALILINKVESKLVTASSANDEVKVSYLTDRVNELRTESKSMTSQFGTETNRSQ